MNVFVTGVAGFIGFHVARALLEADPGVRIVGVDTVNAYYDPALKQTRLDLLRAYGDRFVFCKQDIADAAALRGLFDLHRPQYVVHLAAQAGVRYAATDPFAYTHSNITGFLSVLEACRAFPPAHTLYASSSSVYGLNTELPFAESQKTDAPASLYGATKKANELMAASYAHLYGLRLTGLRLFTVYGPYGRPDMAFFKFVSAMQRGAPIDVYNGGQMQRDFTYIDDVVAAILSLLPRSPAVIPPHVVYNIGGNQPVILNDAIALLEELLGVHAVRNILPMQPGDVPSTAADTAKLAGVLPEIPAVPLREGLSRFVAWYKSYK